jgi:hypothetical protein
MSGEPWSGVSSSGLSGVREAARAPGWSPQPLPHRYRSLVRPTPRSSRCPAVPSKRNADNAVTGTERHLHQKPRPRLRQPRISTASEHSPAALTATARLLNQPYKTNRIVPQLFRRSTEVDGIPMSGQSAEHKAEQRRSDSFWWRLAQRRGGIEVGTPAAPG